jgi:transcriptional regulator with GAF, ATPase, and Fis domain
MAFLRTKQSGRIENFELARKLISIGRSSDADFVLSDARVAEYHAQLSFDGESFVVQPMGKAEVRVNGKRAKKEKLYHNDVISLNGIELFFSLYDAPPDSEPKEKSELNAYRRLYTFSAKLAGEFDITRILEQLLDAVIEVTHADKGFVVLFDGETPVVKAARNISRLNVTNAAGQISDSIVAKVIKTQRALIVSDALHDQEFNAAESVLSLKLASVLCVPLMIRGSLFGVLYLGNDNVVNLFQETSLEVLSVFAAQASLLIQYAMLVNELRVESKELASRLSNLKTEEIIGSSDGLNEVMRKVRKVATTDISVLILGETGTGKELIAREIHRASNRNRGPFIAINCSAIHENLLESELFGYVKGAFTGAIANREGKFHAANKGTLFLDEIGEMPPQLQAKLLRVLQEKAVVRVGDSKLEQVDIRVLAATNRDPKQEIINGRFREDLFYRLNTVTLFLPPLRERGDDVLLLAKYFLQRYALEYNSKVKGFTPAATQAIRRFGWPGNIRDLENRVKKALVLCDKPMIDPEDLEINPSDIPTMTLAQAREDWQRSYVNQVLVRNGGNRTKAAAELGVDPRTVFRFLEKEEGA